MSNSKGKGIAYTMMGSGLLFVYSGAKGYSVLRAIQNIVRGSSPAEGQAVTPIGAPTGENSLVVGSAAGITDVALGNYDQAQLQALWVSAGGSASTARNAACHAMQESSGNPRVTSNNPDGGANVGLWQLDTKGKGAGHTIAQLQDPMTNARITVSATNNGKNWSAWATPGC